jgi:colanic acid/amylovoran biosynthesis glycosyltransferase
MKDTVAIYSQVYLPMSEVFVYRQLLGAAKEFQPIVLTHRLRHLRQFPFDPVEVCERTFFDKAYSKTARTCFGRFDSISPALASRMAQVLRERNVKLVHAHFGPAGLQILPVVKQLEIPLVVTFHGFDASVMLNNPGYVKGLHALFDYAHILTPSLPFRKKMLERGADPERTGTLHIGVPLRDFAFSERLPLREKVRRGETIELLQVARLVEKKGTRYTLLAFRDLLNSYPRCRLSIAGEGPLKEELQSLAATLGISDSVRFLGWVTIDQVARLMHAADIFVHHSVTADNGDQESVPQSITEAMATGAVVVSSFHAGIPELIQDGVCGFLVAERDVTAYAGKLRDALDCGPEMGIKAREVVEANFDLDAQNQKLVHFYREAMHSRATKTGDSTVSAFAAADSATGAATSGVSADRYRANRARAHGPRNADSGTAVEIKRGKEAE